ncbi:MAG: hypothetical protein WC787_04215 [Patescibacteria group bacterium]|jgi:hypothetical protein
MIPLSIFLIAWLILLGIYVLLALVSMTQMIRFSVASSMTYFSTGVFLLVAILVISVTGIYLMTVDWTLGLDMGNIFQGPSIPL